MPTDPWQAIRTAADLAAAARDDERFHWRSLRWWDRQLLKLVWRNRRVAALLKAHHRGRALTNWVTMLKLAMRDHDTPSVQVVIEPPPEPGETP